MGLMVIVWNSIHQILICELTSLVLLTAVFMIDINEIAGTARLLLQGRRSRQKRQDSCNLLIAANGASNIVDNLVCHIYGHFRLAWSRHYYHRSGSWRQRPEWGRASRHVRIREVYCLDHDRLHDIR